MVLFRFACAAGLLAVLGLALSTAPGQGNKRQPPTKAGSGPRITRQVYAVRGLSAKELATALTLHFQAEPTFRVVADTESNTLLLSGPKDALEKATAVLHRIDRPARIVHVEILWLQLTGKTGGEAGADTKPLGWAEWSGPAGEVRAKIRDLQQKGVIGSIKTVELTGLAGQSSRTRVSASRPYVTGVSVSGLGGRGGPGGRGGAGGSAGTMARSITYRDVGMTVQMKPELGADGQVTLDLRVENSRMRPAEGGVAVGTDDKGGAIPAPEFVLSTLESRLKVPPGHIVLAQSTGAGSKAGQVQTVILVGASTEAAGQKNGK